MDDTRDEKRAKDRSDLNEMIIKVDDQIGKDHQEKWSNNTQIEHDEWWKLKHVFIRSGDMRAVEDAINILNIGVTHIRIHRQFLQLLKYGRRDDDRRG